MRKLQGYRTIGYFVLSGIVYLLAWDQLKEVVDPKYLIEAQSFIGIVLRLITTGPVPLGQATPTVPPTPAQ